MQHLISLATRYETAAFLDGDPSQFMHRYNTPLVQERVAFIAAALSYGSRKQFLPKIEQLLGLYDGLDNDPTFGLESGSKNSSLRHRNLPDNDQSFYRLHSNRMLNRFLDVVDEIYIQHGSIKQMVINELQREGKDHNKAVTESLCSTGKPVCALDALRVITHFFAEREASDLIPRNTSSACKRLCMFLRWMVRQGSPVDLGLWSDLIDADTLIIPLDTHVLQEARKLRLITSQTGSMTTALRLTDRLRTIFPGDPTRADYALFGLGVESQ